MCVKADKIQQWDKIKNMIKILGLQKGSCYVQIICIIEYKFPPAQATPTKMPESLLIMSNSSEKGFLNGYEVVIGQNCSEKYLHTSEEVDSKKLSTSLCNIQRRWSSSHRRNL